MHKLTTLVEKVVEVLNDVMDQVGNGELISILENASEESDYYGPKNNPWLHFEFDGKQRSLLEFEPQSGGYWADGQDISFYLTVEGQYVGIAGNYSSWDSHYWEDEWSVGKLTSYTITEFVKVKA